MPELEWKDWGEAKNKLSISELKRALVEVRDICKDRVICGGCPFDNEHANSCPIIDRPDYWDVDDWKEDSE